MTFPSGSLKNGSHFFPLRVYVQHTDLGGIVYYSRYLEFAEQARTEFLRLLDIPHHLFLKEKEGFMIVRACQASYLKPARLDDFLEVRTTLKRIGGASLTLAQDVLCEETLLVEMNIRLGWVKPPGVAAKLPPALYARLSEYVKE